MNKKLEKLYARSQAVQASLDEIETAVEANEDGAFTPEQRTQFAALVAESKQIREDIDLVTEREMARVAEWTDNRDRSVPVVLADGAVITSAENPNGPFKTFGHQLQAIYNVGVDPNSPDAVEALDQLRRVAAASGMSAGQAADGGFLIQTDYTTRMLDKATTEAQLVGMCDEIPMSANADGISAPYIEETSRVTGSRWGGVQVYWKAEAATVAASKPKIGEFNLELEEMMGIAYATKKLMRHAPTAEKILGDAFTSELAFRLDDGIIRGTGAAQMLGILNSPALISIDRTSQGATTFFSENAIAMFSRMPSRYIGGSVWLINQDVLPQLLAMSFPGVAAAAGSNPLYLAAGQLKDAPYGMLLGRPVKAIEHASTLGAAGDVMLVNLKEYALIGSQMEAAQSMHVRFLNDEQTFRWVLPRNGAPKWKTALTPYQGTATVSPFITCNLATT